MARQGVTYTEIAEAANQLLGQGRNPTIEQVRLVLGTGSSTTIAAHLKTWKESQSGNSLIAAKENVPEELIAMVKGLWERVVMISDEKLKSITANYQSTLDEVQGDLHKYRNNNQRWQHLFELWNREKDHFIEDKKQLAAELKQQQQDNAALKAQYDQAIQQLVDKEDRLKELQRLNEQIQLNHQHYRETVKEQQQREQEQFAEQKKLLHQEIAKLNHELLSRKQQEEILVQNNRRHEQEILQLTNDKNTLEATLKTSDKEKREHLLSAQHWESQYRSLQQDSNAQMLQSRTELNHMSQQLMTLQQAINAANDNYANLQQVNLDLVREKSMLEGRIKQWDIGLSINDTNQCSST